MLQIQQKTHFNEKERDGSIGTFFKLLLFNDFYLLMLTLSLSYPNRTGGRSAVALEINLYFGAQLKVVKDEVKYTPRYTLDGSQQFYPSLPHILGISYPKQIFDINIKIGKIPEA